LIHRNSLFMNPRFWVAIPFLVGSAFALSEWFSLGVAASGWIGLPQFAPAMQKLNTESGRWGLAALALQCVAILMILPRKPKKSAPAFSTGWPPSEPLDAHAWIEHLGHCVLRTALCCFITILLVVVYVFLSLAIRRPVA
jgi:hypothetical protein